MFHMQQYLSRNLLAFRDYARAGPSFTTLGTVFILLRLSQALNITTAATTFYKKAFLNLNLQAIFIGKMRRTFFLSNVFPQRTVILVR